MRKYLLIMFTIAVLSIAQQLTFIEKIDLSYDDRPQQIIRTSDNGYALTGTLNRSSGADGNLFLSKFDHFGKHIWTREFSGAGEDNGYSLVETNDGGLIVGGRTNSVGTGGYDFLLSKFDSSGNFLWAKTIGGPNDDHGGLLKLTDDGGYILAGSTVGFGASNRNLLIVKLDSLGNFSWATTIGWYWHSSSSAIIETADKGYIVTGSSWSFGSNDLCPIICKLDSLGNSLWTRQIGPGVYPADANHANDLIEISNGDLFFVGFTEEYSAGGARDCFLSKFNSTGTHLWTKTWGGAGNDDALSIVLNSDNKIVIAGETQSYGAGSSDIFLSKFDTAGTHLWSRTIGGTGFDYGNSMVLAGDAGYTISGYTDSFGVSDTFDIILVKCDSLGITCLGDTVTPILGSPSPPIGTYAPDEYSHPTPTILDFDTLLDINIFIPDDVSLICGDETPPDSFNLISPPDSTILAIARPTFIWESSYDALGLENYEVYIKDTLRTICTDTFWTADYNLSEEYNNWYVITYDSMGNSTRSDETWNVIIDTSGPFIDSTTIWEDTTFSGPFPVYTKVTGLNKIDIVRLYYKKLEDPAWFSKEMIEGTSNWYYEEIPTASLSNDTIRYYIYAADTLPDEATDPSEAPSDYYSFVANKVSGIDEDNTIPKIFSLTVNSIAKDKSVFRFSLPERAAISLAVYDITGRPILRLKSIEYSPGYYEIPFEAKRKGVYFYEFKSPYKDAKGKLVIF